MRYLITHAQGYLSYIKLFTISSGGTMMSSDRLAGMKGTNC